MQLFLIIIFVVVIVSAIKKANEAENAKKNQQNRPGQYNPSTGSYNMPSNMNRPPQQTQSYTPQQPARSYTPTAPPQTARYNNRPRAGYNPAVDTHLCDEGAHAAESGASYAATLYEMEQGYQSYTPAPISFQQGAYRRLDLRRLTADELRKKQEELKDLRDAGIITTQEYNQKMREYATGY